MSTELVQRKNNNNNNNNRRCGNYGKNLKTI